VARHMDNYGVFPAFDTLATSKRLRAASRGDWAFYCKMTPMTWRRAHAIDAMDHLALTAEMPY